MILRFMERNNCRYGKHLPTHLPNEEGCSERVVSPSTFLMKSLDGSVESSLEHASMILTSSMSLCIPWFASYPLWCSSATVELVVIADIRLEGGHDTSILFAFGATSFFSSDASSWRLKKWQKANILIFQ